MVILSSSQLIENFRISRETLRRWREKGLSQVDRGKFDLAVVIRWRDENLFGGGELEAVRLKREVAKCRFEELKAQEKAESLVPRDEAIKWLSALVLEAKQALLNLPRRMGPVLAPKNDEREIEIDLRSEIYSILETLARPINGKNSKRNKKSTKPAAKNKHPRLDRGKRGAAPVHIG